MSENKRPLMYAPHANMLPYGVSVGAPPITVPDVSGFKQIKLVEAQHFVDQRFDEIKKQYEELLEVVRINELVYNSEYKFIPIIGQTYYIWERENGTTWMSQLGPDDNPLWEGNCLGAYKLNSYSVWINA